MAEENVPSPAAAETPQVSEPASAGVALQQSNRLSQSQRKAATEGLKSRLFDPKKRTIGIDKDALDQQVKEKASLKGLHKQRDDYFAQQALLQDKQAKWAEHEVAKMRKERAMDTESFRAEKQRKDQRREWDLNDPHRLRKDAPARVGDDDVRCTASGLQKFDGEDTDAADRRKAQAEQITRWAQQQIQERNMQKSLEKQMDALAAERTEAVTHKAWAMERAIEKKRTDHAVACAEFNKKLAAQKQREKLAEKAYEQRCNMQEIQNMLDSDFLGESEAVTVNPQKGGRGIGTGPNYKRDNMKGLHPGQRGAILSEQQMQREENASRRQKEKEEQAQIELQEEQERRMAHALERQRMRERRQDRVNVGNERKNQAADAALKRANLDQMYRNKIGDDFFSFVDSNVR